MPPTAYQFDIARADRAADLHHLTADITADDTLTSDEKSELLDLIRRKFSTWNAQALSRQKPRW
jgi:hypothetical protein